MMERNRRIGKAYARVPIVTIDGSHELSYDGYKLALNGFDNPDRDSETEQCKKRIGKGIRIKMDKLGNILIKRLSKSGVYIKEWINPINGGSSNHGAHPMPIRRQVLKNQLSSLSTNGTPTTTSSSSSSGSSMEPSNDSAICDEVLSIGGRLENDKIYIMFDMEKFQSNITQELCRPYPDRRKLEQQCFSIVSLTCDSDDILNLPCWVMVINIVAIEMLNVKFPLMPGDRLGFPDAGSVGLRHNEAPSFVSIFDNQPVHGSSKMNNHPYSNSTNKEEDPYSLPANASSSDMKMSSGIEGPYGVLPGNNSKQRGYYDRSRIYKQHNDGYMLSSRHSRVRSSGNIYNESRYGGAANINNNNHGNISKMHSGSRGNNHHNNSSSIYSPGHMLVLPDDQVPPKLPPRDFVQKGKSKSVSNVNGRFDINADASHDDDIYSTGMNLPMMNDFMPTTNRLNSSSNNNNMAPEANDNKKSTDAAGVAGGRKTRKNRFLESLKAPLTKSSSSNNRSASVMGAPTFAKGSNTNGSSDHSNGNTNGRQAASGNSSVLGGGSSSSASASTTNTKSRSGGFSKSSATKNIKSFLGVSSKSSKQSNNGSTATASSSNARSGKDKQQLSDDSSAYVHLDSDKMSGPIEATTNTKRSIQTHISSDCIEVDSCVSCCSDCNKEDVNSNPLMMLPPPLDDQRHHLERHQHQHMTQIEPIDYNDLDIPTPDYETDENIYAIGSGNRDGNGATYQSSTAKVLSETTRNNINGKRSLESGNGVSNGNSSSNNNNNHDNQNGNGSGNTKQKTKQSNRSSTHNKEDLYYSGFRAHIPQNIGSTGVAGSCSRSELLTGATATDTSGYRPSRLSSTTGKSSLLQDDRMSCTRSSRIDMTTAATTNRYLNASKNNSKLVMSKLSGRGTADLIYGSTLGLSQHQQQQQRNSSMNGSRIGSRYRSASMQRYYPRSQSSANNADMYYDLDMENPYAMSGASSAMGNPTMATRQGRNHQQHLNGVGHYGHYGTGLGLDDGHRQLQPGRRRPSVNGRLSSAATTVQQQQVPLYDDEDGPILDHDGPIRTSGSANLSNAINYDIGRSSSGIYGNNSSCSSSDYVDWHPQMRKVSSSGYLNSIFKQQQQHYASGHNNHQIHTNQRTAKSSAGRYDKSNSSAFANMDDHGDIDQHLNNGNSTTGGGSKNNNNNINSNDKTNNGINGDNHNNGRCYDGNGVDDDDDNNNGRVKNSVTPSTIRNGNSSGGYNSRTLETTQSATGCKQKPTRQDSSTKDSSQTTGNSHSKSSKQQVVAQISSNVDGPGFRLYDSSNDSDPSYTNSSDGLDIYDHLDAGDQRQQTNSSRRHLAEQQKFLNRHLPHTGRVGGGVHVGEWEDLYNR